MEIQMHQWVKDNGVKVKLMKMSKGYQWEITYEHTDDTKLIDRIDKINSELKKRYGSEESNA